MGSFFFGAENMMPTYCYKCDKCGKHEDIPRPDNHRDVALPCREIKCTGWLQRDLLRELESQRHSGKLRNWLSLGAAVNAGQVQEANRLYADLDVHFDKRGMAHVPGRNRDKFLKRRGFVQLEDAPRRNRYAKRITATDAREKPRPALALDE